MTDPMTIRHTITEYDTALADLQRRATGDAGRLTVLAVAAARVARHTAAAGAHLTTARSGLAHAWAAPSGENFRTSTEKLPGRCAAAGELCLALAEGAHRVVRELEQAQTAIEVEISLFRWHANSIIVQVTGPVVPDGLLAEARQRGERHTAAARTHLDRLDAALIAYADTVATRTRAFAAAGA